MGISVEKVNEMNVLSQLKHNLFYDDLRKHEEEREKFIAKDKELRKIRESSSVSIISDTNVKKEESKDEEQRRVPEPPITEHY